MMIIIGIVSVIFFLYSMFQRSNISYLPLYGLLMITLVYYCLKYLHEWYHYFSITVDKQPVPNRKYSVDILTTYCPGEPFDMLEETLTAIQKITYPHTAWCCDEADDPSVKELCNKLGVKHVTRKIKINAKAGNINNALQYATGDLCLVLDPDHVPAPEMLDQLVAYFDDPSIGFVQVVQAYYNQGESLVAKGAAQQTYQFYGPMMMGMNGYGTVQAIGANCTFRRKALDTIGGHSSGLAEDMHTAMQLHAAGWRSVYVPSILTRGLVPATMSSYFKQQLKWSRGTWELLLVTYPALFKKFTLRQKIHYLTLPFHYLSGFIFLLNFLIPVISLFTGYIPLKMDVLQFLLAAVPLFTMGILVRHYVQKWVVEENERGFHMVGGILQIGTWWIHSIGFIYTVLRKNIPYIPTPKNDSDRLPFVLSLPNIMIAVISLAAICYGLWSDYNPYTIFMVVLASMQIVFMVFIFFISGYVRDASRANRLADRLKENTWLIVKTHGFLRRYSLPLSLLMIICFIVGFRQQKQLSTFLPAPMPGLEVFYPGYYQTYRVDSVQGNYFSPALVKSGNISIISVDVPWGQGEKNKLDTAMLQKIYLNNYIPLINWQLWQENSKGMPAFDSAVSEHIIQGKYDDRITQFAMDLARLNKTVFLSCGIDSMDNKHPLFAPSNDDPQQFVSAWQHMHKLFKQAGVDKVVWIWNPWNPASVNDYFPGHKYVDWLGVNVSIANTGKLIADPFSLDSVYRPFHILPLFRSGLPVMITKTTGHAVNTAKWWNATWKTIDTAFNEVRSVIIGGAGSTPFIEAEPGLRQLPLQITMANAPAGSKPLLADEIKWNASIKPVVKHLPENIKAVVYEKGLFWFRNRHTLGSKTLQQDISSMKRLGINTIERTMPGFYDDNLEKVMMENTMNLITRFSIPGNSEDLQDQVKLRSQKEDILKVVKENSHKEHIIAWNLGNDVLYFLSNQTYKPDYFHYQQTYVMWLQDVCSEIRKLDSVRPIIMDLHWDANGPERLLYYKKWVPHINNYMLVADAKYPAAFKEPLPEGTGWGRVAVELWPLIPSIRHSGIIPAWQDIENTEYINMNGLLDMDGRKKQWFSRVSEIWGKGDIVQQKIPDIKILRPAVITRGNNTLLYHAIYKKNNAFWMMYNDEDEAISFEWHLVRTDQYGNTLFIKKVGQGPSLYLSLPNQPEFYRLYLKAIVGDDIKMVNTSLNTPLE